MERLKILEEKAGANVLPFEAVARTTRKKLYTSEI
jgi:hypothetical protein